VARTEKNNGMADKQDRVIIERAKKLLMIYLNLSEPQAHRFIEKQAMDLRKKRIQIAEGILKMYES
jgi:response regulator NasT